jgi:hypothetical protein
MQQEILVKEAIIEYFKNETVVNLSVRPPLEKPE